jgi:hypothetical protein
LNFRKFEFLAEELLHALDRGKILPRVFYTLISLQLMELIVVFSHVENLLKSEVFMAVKFLNRVKLRILNDDCDIQIGKV